VAHARARAHVVWTRRATGRCGRDDPLIVRWGWAGKKSGDGCLALPRGDFRGTSPQHKDEVCYFEFELQGGLEMEATGYSLRNGSKDYGTYPNTWVLQQCDADDNWSTLAREEGDRLDGNRQALCKFDIPPASTPPGYASRFRIKSCGPRLERHPLWLLSVELFGNLRRAKPCGPPGSTCLSARVVPGSGGGSRRDRDMDLDAKEGEGEEQEHGDEGLSLTTIPSSVSCSPVSNKTAAAIAKSQAGGGVTLEQRRGSAGVGGAGGGSGASGAGGEDEEASCSASRRKAPGTVGKGAGGRKQAKADEDPKSAAAGCKSATKGPPIPMKGIASFFKKA